MPAGSAAGRSSGAAPGTPGNLLHLPPRRPGRPCGSPQREDGARGRPTEPTRSTRGSRWCLGEQGAGSGLSPLGTWPCSSGPSATVVVPGGQGGGPPSGQGTPSRSGFGVLMANPGGGAKAGSEARGSAGACSCSARLSVRLRFPPVPPSPLVATGEPRGHGTVLTQSLPSAPKSCRERGVQGAASLGCPMVWGWGLLGVSPAELGPVVLVRMGCHLPAGCPGCRGGDGGLSPCVGTGIASSLPTLLQPPGAPQSGLG